MSALTKLAKTLAKFAEDMQAEKAGGGSQVAVIPNRNIKAGKVPPFATAIKEGGLEQFPRGAFVEVPTGRIMTNENADRVMVQPAIGRPLPNMVVRQGGETPEVRVSGRGGKGEGGVIKSNLLRKDQFRVVDGDPMLQDANSIFTMVPSGNHFYGASADFRLPTKLYDDVANRDNPFMRPSTSNANIYGGEVIGTIETKSGKKQHPIYDQLVAVPRGSEAPEGMTKLYSILSAMGLGGLLSGEEEMGDM